MSDFTFDGNKRSSENSANFLQSIEDIDPEMAEILQVNWDKLLTVVREGERDSKARAEFNETIAVALDEFLTRDTDGENE
ncbi:hypothetical protein [Litorimonas sp.]|uniref:hypothetical protein n=1 Tax=Litorimonas sp. TaxID=1892381 RepID=UPI003A87E3BD